MYCTHDIGNHIQFSFGKTLIAMIGVDRKQMYNPFRISARLPELVSSFGNQPGKKHLFFQLPNTLRCECDNI